MGRGHFGHGFGGRHFGHGFRGRHFGRFRRFGRDDDYWGPYACEFPYRYNLPLYFCP
jgi:hypothetical protein